MRQQHRHNLAGAVWLGHAYLTEGNYEAAIVAFTAAIEIEPNEATLYIARGDAYVLSGETEENLTLAYEDYNTAISIDSTVAEAYLGLANVYILQGDIDSAVAILTEGLGRAEYTESIQKKLDELSENAEESVEIVELSVWEGSIADSFDGGSGTTDHLIQRIIFIYSTVWWVEWLRYAMGVVL